MWKTALNFSEIRKQFEVICCEIEVHWREVEKFNLNILLIAEIMFENSSI